MREDPLLEELVYTLVQLVPPGRVTTYKSIADVLGTHPRRVAQILKKNKRPIEIPCHRVVYSNMRIGGYSLGREMKKRLLELEGVEILGDRVSREKHYIDLAKELLEDD